MKDGAIKMANEKFRDALLESGMDESSFTLLFDSELEQHEDYYSFLFSVQIVGFDTDEGRLDPKPVIFQVDYQADEQEIQIIMGEDTPMDITYGNVFAYMYFSAIEPN